MTRLRAALTAAVLFGGMCLPLGALGVLMIDSAMARAIYGVAVLGFAIWVSRETYLGCRAGPGTVKFERSA